MIPLSKEKSEFPEVGNIRSICVLPVVSKVFEKVMLKRLRTHMDENNCLHEAQKGFTVGKSTINCISDMRKALQESKEHAL